MTENELKKLSRIELLEILAEVTERNEALKIENDGLKACLEAREIPIKNAGSIAEASLELSNVFAEAQKAADIYLENIRRQEEESKQRTEAIIRSMEENCRLAEDKVKETCNALRAATENECAEKLRATEENCAALEQALKERYKARFAELETQRAAFEAEAEALRQSVQSSTEESRRGLFGRRK